MRADPQLYSQQRRHSAKHLIRCRNQYTEHASGYYIRRGRPTDEPLLCAILVKKNSTFVKLCFRCTVILPSHDINLASVRDMIVTSMFLVSFGAHCGFNHFSHSVFGKPPFVFNVLLVCSFRQSL